MTTQEIKDLITFSLKKTEEEHETGHRPSLEQKETLFKIIDALALCGLKGVSMQVLVSENNDLTLKCVSSEDNILLSFELNDENKITVISNGTTEFYYSPNELIEKIEKFTITVRQEKLKNLGYKPGTEVFDVMMETLLEEKEL